ncbi:MAG: hypothetical protein FWG63_04300 [Defluviitaleaceae bacterium]|nr:hypothetical protein [Defluviitaleaceae bacterium]
MPANLLDITTDAGAENDSIQNLDLPAHYAGYGGESPQLSNELEIPSLELEIPSLNEDSQNLPFDENLESSEIQIPVIDGNSEDLPLEESSEAGTGTEIDELDNDGIQTRDLPLAGYGDDESSQSSEVSDEDSENLPLDETLRSSDDTVLDENSENSLLEENSENLETTEESTLNEDSDNSENLLSDENPEDPANLENPEDPSDDNEESEENEENDNILDGIDTLEEGLDNEILLRDGNYVYVGDGQYLTEEQYTYLRDIMVEMGLDPYDPIPEWLLDYLNNTLNIPEGDYQDIRDAMSRLGLGWHDPIPHWLLNQWWHGWPAVTGGWLVDLPFGADLGL